MRLRFWKLIVALVVIGAAGAGAIYYLHVRRVSSTADLVSFLPASNSTIVYIDVAAIRRAGILNMLAGSKAAEDPNIASLWMKPSSIIGRIWML